MTSSSIITSNWEQLKTQLPDIIAEYDKNIALAPQRLSIKGKSGGEALKDQCAWPIQYSVQKAEVTKLAKLLEARVEAIRGQLTKRYTESYSRTLPDRIKDKYIDNEPEYLNMYALYLEIVELRDKLEAICDAFDRRGFALRDWTLLKTNQAQDDII